MSNTQHLTVTNDPKAQYETLLVQSAKADQPLYTFKNHPPKKRNFFVATFIFFFRLFFWIMDWVTGNGDWWEKEDRRTVFYDVTDHRTGKTFTAIKKKWGVEITENGKTTGQIKYVKSKDRPFHEVQYNGQMLGKVFDSAEKEHSGTIETEDGQSVFAYSKQSWQPLNHTIGNIQIAKHLPAEQQTIFTTAILMYGTARPKGDSAD